MHPKTRFVFTASLDVDHAKDDLFNEVYDTEHVPFPRKWPGRAGVDARPWRPGPGPSLPRAPLHNGASGSTAMCCAG